MERLAVSRLLDGAGCVFIALAAILFTANGSFTSSAVPGFGGAVSSAAGNVFGSIFEWGCAIFGGLLFLGRPLLRLRWWKSWIAFLLGGAFLLLIAINGLPIFADNPSLRMHIDLATDLAGVSSIFMALVFAIAQSLVRRSERIDPTKV